MREEKLREQQLKLCEIEKVSEELLNIIKNEEYDCLQIQQIRLGIKHGLGQDVSIYANPLLDHRKMLLLRISLERKERAENVALAAKSEYSYEQLNEILMGFEEGLPVQFVKKYMDAGLTYRQMADIRLSGISQSEAETGISKKDMVKAAANAAKSSVKKNKETVKVKTIKLDGFSEAQLAVINLGRNDGMDEEQLKVMCRAEFSPEQMQQIRWGFTKNHLSLKQVSVYAKKEYEVNKMSVLRDALKAGLGEKEMELLMDDGYNVSQISQLLTCFKNDISFENIKLIADPEIPAYKMQEYRMGFCDGLTAEEMELVK